MIILWPRHIRRRCPPNCRRCLIDSCPNQVLFTCSTCGATEAQLPTDCPGRKMTQSERQAVLDLELDYTAEKGWFELHRVIRSD